MDNIIETIENEPIMQNDQIYIDFETAAEIKEETGKCAVAFYSPDYGVGIYFDEYDNIVTYGDDDDKDSAIRDFAEHFLEEACIYFVLGSFKCMVCICNKILDAYISEVAEKADDDNERKEPALE